MFLTVCGAALVAATSASYRRLLPRNGKVHPLVNNSDIGSMITIALMTTFTLGVALLFAGFYG